MRYPGGLCPILGGEEGVVFLLFCLLAAGFFLFS